MLFESHILTKLSSLGPDDGWSRPHVIALLVVGIALLIIFVLWQRIFPNPLMPPHIWKDRNFSLVSPDADVLVRIVLTTVDHWSHPAWYHELYG